MAKKTKKEKILAEYHRKMQLLQSSRPPASEARFTVPSSQYQLPEQKVTVSTVNSVYRAPTADHSYVLSDLRRILFLAALAICAQLVLWYSLGRR